VNLEPHIVLAGRYRLERLLGEGGMGMVWEAFDLHKNNSVALKFLKGPSANTPAMHKRFAREARAAMAVSHPNVVRVHEVTVADDGSPMMVMDFLRGESLEARRARIVRFAIPQFARIFQRVLSGVGTAHAVGIVHRDLKPDNIFLVKPEDGPEDVCVLDFGIAKLTASEGDAAATAHLTATGAVMGTPYYMSPEQVFGEKNIDHRADIWSLGVILYECLCGKKPFEGDNFGQLFKSISMGTFIELEHLVPGLPKDIGELSTRMLANKREHRLGDLREAYEVFKSYASDVQSFAAPSILLTADEVRLAIAGASSGNKAVTAAAFADTAITVPQQATADTAVPVSQTSGDNPRTTPAPPPRSKRSVVLAGVALLAVVSVGVVAVRLRPPTPEPVGLAAGNGALGAPLHLATADPFATPSASVATSASASSSAVASASASAVPKLAVASTRAPSAASRAALAASASAKSIPAPSPSTPSTASTKKSVPGGIATETPF
jgi:serine/threonine protein kinase